LLLGSSKYTHIVLADGTIVRDKAFILLLVWKYIMLRVPIRLPDLRGERIHFM